MKSGMNAATGEVITGVPYLRQRLADVINTPLGSIVGRRDFGSMLFELIDRNVDSRFQMDAYVRLANAINNKANGLDDFKLDQMSIVRLAKHHIQISVSGDHLVTDESVQLDGIDLYGRN